MIKLTKGKLFNTQDVANWNINILLEEAKNDIPKKYIYTDYSHYYKEDADGVEHPPYPEYQHVPINEEWETWFRKWFGDEE